MSLSMTSYLYDWVRSNFVRSFPSAVTLHCMVDFQQVLIWGMLRIGTSALRITTCCMTPFGFYPGTTDGACSLWGLLWGFFASEILEFFVNVWLKGKRCYLLTSSDKISQWNNASPPCWSPRFQKVLQRIDGLSQEALAGGICLWTEQ